MNTNNNDFDLDGLKDLWKGAMLAQTETEYFNNQEILFAMQQKTTAAAKAFQRNLLIEILVTIPMVVAAYIGSLYLPFTISPLLWVAFIIITFGYHVYLYWKLQNQQPDTETLLVSIEKQVSEMRGFIKMYKSMEIVFAVTCPLAILILAHARMNTNYGVLLVAVLLAIFGGIGAVVSLRWYVNKLYGQHYNTLLQTYETLKGA